jgi:hypothetical protein
MVHDVDGCWFVIYEGLLYDHQLEALVCSRCESDVRADVKGHWISRMCGCSVVCVMVCDR